MSLRIRIGEHHQPYLRSKKTNKNAETNSKDGNHFNKPKLKAGSKQTNIHTQTLSDIDKYIYRNEEGCRAILLVQMFTLAKQITQIVS